MTRCSVPGCGKPILARGYCSAHYGRFRKYGDPTHRVIAPHGAPRKWISIHAADTGDACLEWPFKSVANGYGILWIEGRSTPIGAHRLMCIVAHGEPPTAQHQAAHSCGNRLCCNPSHLRWATGSENASDKYEHGTANHGERNPRAVLTANDVRSIRAMAAAGSSSPAIARIFGISRRNVSMVVQRSTWKHVE